jgi:hypothetical protein
MVALIARNIISISEGGLLYRDLDGFIRLIDLRQCNAHWIASRGAYLTLFDLFCVGWRNTGDRRILDVELFTEPKTRFVFRSYAQRDTVMLRPLVRSRWHTFDLSRDARR